LIKSIHLSFTKFISNCVVLRLERGIMLTKEGEEIIDCIIEQNADIKWIQQKIFDMLTQCIEDIQKTITASGLNIEDIGSDPINSRQAWILSSMV
jgi:hypothetical protein